MRALAHRFLCWFPIGLATVAWAVTERWPKQSQPWVDRAVEAMSHWPTWVALAIFSTMYVGAIIWTGRERVSRTVPDAPPPVPPLTAEEAAVYQRTKLAQLRAEEERAMDAEQQARSSREFHRGLDAYVRGEPRAPAPLAGQAHIGTLGAAVFGIDTAESYVAIDIKNFGQTPAHNVTWKAVAGWFPKQPAEPVHYEADGSVGVTEPGHSQHIMLILTHPLTSAHIQRAVRGGEGFYALAQIDYTDASGAQRRRRIAYYLDQKGQRLPDRWMLSVSPSGNDELEGRMEEKSAGTVHNVTSHGQKGGITAHTVNVARRPPRVLVDGMQAELLQKLPRAKPVSIEAVMGDQEAIHFATQIMSFLRDSGYSFQNNIVIAAMFNQPVKGIVIEPNGIGYRLIVGANE